MSDEDHIKTGLYCDRGEGKVRVYVLRTYDRGSVPMVVFIRSRKADPSQREVRVVGVVFMAAFRRMAWPEVVAAVLGPVG